MALDVDMSEANRLAVELGRAALSIGPAIQQVVRKSALDVERESKMFAPVDTGFLRGSIGIDPDGDRLGAAIGPAANYGGFVEFGTSQHGPQAYMGPAFDRAQPGFLAAIEQVLADNL